MKRQYEAIIKDHLTQLTQMVFLAGPRQVGKTTIARHILEQEAGIYLNWDILKDRELILSGPENIMKLQNAPRLGKRPPITVLDEMHKFKGWKNYLKGFFDQFKEATRIVVTGSSRLDTFVKGGDSLMGRYFPYTVHPITVSELTKGAKPEGPVSAPKKLATHPWQSLWNYGGFPDPYLQSNQKFFNQWQNLRQQQLFREEVVDLNKVNDLSQFEVLSSLIEVQSGQLVNYSRLSKSVRVTDQTVRRWFDLLESVYYCFRIRPWFQNVSRSLRKEPKVYLWDWSNVKEQGARAENFVASHLNKAVSLWTQTGLGKFDLFFLRDKEKNEVDFLVSRDDLPWFLVEVKKSSTRKITPALDYFQRQLKAPHAFQVVFNAAYVDKDCFAHRKPLMVPARTLLSQLG